MSRMLLAFDLDGTLLDDDKHIPEENIRAIAAAAERGWVPVPATGRIFRGIPQPVKELPGVRWFIVSNGAGVYDAKEDRLLLRADISPEQAMDAAAVDVRADIYSLGIVFFEMLAGVSPYSTPLSVSTVVPSLTQYTVPVFLTRFRPS